MPDTTSHLARDIGAENRALAGERDGLKTKGELVPGMRRTDVKGMVFVRRGKN